MYKEADGSCPVLEFLRQANKSMKKKKRTTTDALKIMDTVLGAKDPHWKERVKAARERQTLGDLIREAREKERITQSELARRAHTTQSAISRLEDADYETMKLDTLQKIAQALGLSLTIALGKQKFQVRRQVPAH